MVLCIKKNKCILDIFLDVYIFLLEIATVDHLQHIHHIRCLPALMCLCFFSEWSPYMFINLLPYYHAIKLVNTGANMCLSTLDW